MTGVPDKKSFPEANVDKELNPGHNKRVEVDSTSSSIAASLTNKEKEEAEKKKAGAEKKDCGDNSLKTRVLISVIFAAIAGAAFGIAKKLREKQT